MNRYPTVTHFRAIRQHLPQTPILSPRSPKKTCQLVRLALHWNISKFCAIWCDIVWSTLSIIKLQGKKGLALDLEGPASHIPNRSQAHPWAAQFSGSAELWIGQFGQIDSGRRGFQSRTIQKHPEKCINTRIAFSLSGIGTEDQRTW